MAYKLGLSPAAAADVTAVAALGSTPFSPACKAVAEAVMAGAALTAAPATTRLGERNAVFSMFIPKVIPDSVGSHLNEIIASRLQKNSNVRPSYRDQHGNGCKNQCNYRNSFHFDVLSVFL